MTAKIINEKHIRLYARLMMAALATLGLFIFLDYGISADEEIHVQYGADILDYYLSGFHSQNVFLASDLYKSGGFFDLITTIAARSFFYEKDIFPLRHIMNMSVGLLGIWGTWRLGNILGGAKVGLLSMFFLALMPLYFGLMFIDPVSIPFAVGVVWMTYYMGKTLQKDKTTDIVKLGLILGLTLSVHISAFFYFIMWAVVACLDKRHLLIKTTKSILIVAALGLFVLTLFWPLAQKNIVLNPLIALSDCLSIRTVGAQSFLDLPKNILMTMPPFILALVLIYWGMIPNLWKIIPENNYRRPLFVLANAFILLPALYVMLTRSVGFDETRNFLFLYPILCVFSAMALRQGCLWLGYGQDALKPGLIAIICLLTISAAYHISTMVALHPYQYIYVSSAESTLADAADQRELDYWGLSIKEAIRELNSFVQQDGQDKTYKVSVCAPTKSAEHYLTPNFALAGPNDKVDFRVATLHGSCGEADDGGDGNDPIIAIQRLGAPLSYVKDLRDISFEDGGQDFGSDPADMPDLPQD